MDDNVDLIWATLESLKNKETKDLIDLLQKTLIDAKNTDNLLQKNSVLKTEKEIKDEIEATERTIKNYRNAYKEGTIDRDIFKNQLTDCTATIDALKWVLGENNRYD